ncbi:MAG: hypothetical protein QW520_07060 [Methanomassiliicoccales archaeon]
MKSEPRWPVIPGEYVIGAKSSPIAILIIGRGFVDLPPDNFAIIGSLKTENIGLEMVIANIVSNPRIRFLIICGKEEFGHFPADAIMKLWKNGIDKNKRIKEARSAIPYLCNINEEVIQRFRKQVQIIDLVYPKDADEIIAYDPIYIFENERKEELLEKIKKCKDSDPGIFPAEPILIDNEIFCMDTHKIIRTIDRLALDFTDQMLRLPSEKLSTDASLIAISENPSVILDPVDGIVVEVPSINFIYKLKLYYRGEC